MPGWLAVPRDWLSSLGEIAKFCGRTMGLVYSGRVLPFFGEALRQAGILILGSTIVIWGLVFILGLQCGIEGAYFNRSVGAPAYAGVFSAWCDLRELVPYAFGYMLAAKVGTGIVAELGAMRISDEIDALEVLAAALVDPLLLVRQGHPPIGARGLAPQKTRVPSIPMMWTKTILRTMDLAVAVPTPTGPPEAV